MIRHVTSLVLIVMICFFMFFLRQFTLIPFDLLLLFFLIVAGLEMRKAFKLNGKQPMLIPIIIFSVTLYPVMYVMQYVLGKPMELGLVIVLLVSSISALANFTFKFARKTDENGEPQLYSPHTLEDLTSTIFILLYPMSFVAMFIVMNNGVGDLLGIVLILLSSLLTDTFALFVGKAFGKKKLVPHISPKKTVAGAVGGLFGGIIGSFVVFFIFDFGHLFDSMKNITIPSIGSLGIGLGGVIAIYAVLGILVALATESGDLAASLIKRKTGIKDFGKIFPGHGGVMDRLDALIFTLPLIYCLFRFLV